MVQIFIVLNSATPVSTRGESSFYRERKRVSLPAALQTSCLTLGDQRGGKTTYSSHPSIYQLLSGVCFAHMCTWSEAWHRLERWNSCFMLGIRHGQTVWVVIKTLRSSNHLPLSSFSSSSDNGFIPDTLLEDVMKALDLVSETD